MIPQSHPTFHSSQSATVIDLSKRLPADTGAEQPGVHSGKRLREEDQDGVPDKGPKKQKPKVIFCRILCHSIEHILFCRFALFSTGGSRSSNGG